MKIVGRILIALVALFGLGLAVLAIVLPGIVDSPETRALIAESSEAQIGRPLEFEKLSLGLLPPSIDVVAPRIAGETAEAEPLFAADVISLRIALLPLLSLTVRVDSLLVDHARIALVNTPEGLALPTPPPAEVPVEASESDASAPPVKLDVQQVEIRAARIALEDRASAKPVTWQIEPIDLMLTGSAEGGPVQLTGRAELGTGGAIEVSGQLDLERLAAELKVTLDAIDLRAAADYAGEGAILDARLDGAIELSIVDSAPRAVTTTLTLNATRVVVGGAEVTGPTRLESEIDLSGDAPKGHFLLDAGAAQILVPETFVKPKGVVLSADGRFSAPAEKPLRVDIGKFALHDFVAHVTAEVGDATRLGVDAPPFDLAGWDALLPSLPPGLLGGKAAIRGLRVQDTPLNVKGEISLEPLSLALAPGKPATLRGVLRGEGDVLSIPGMDFQAGEQHVTLMGRVNALSGKQSFAFNLQSKGVLRANPLVTATTGYADTLFGPLEFDGRVTGALADEKADVLQTLAGYFHFDLGRGVGKGEEGGRLDGVSVLKSVWSGFEDVGTAAQIAGALTGAKVPNLEKYFGDEFDRMDARLQIRDGHLDTERLRIIYRNYGVTLNGRMRLSDQALDMKGEVELGKAIVSAMGAEAEDGEVVIPLAHVGGTAFAPEFDVSSETAKVFARELLARNPKVRRAKEKIGREADKVLPGASKALGDLLGK